MFKGKYPPLVVLFILLILFFYSSFNPLFQLTHQFSTSDALILRAHLEYIRNSLKESIAETNKLHKIFNTSLLNTPNHADDSIKDYLSHLELLYGLDDPYLTAVQAWKQFRVFPISFARSVTKWEAKPRSAPLAEIYNDRFSLSQLLAQKTREWAIVIPGNHSTYIFWNDEEIYINGYREAWKAHTWKKGGVDCNRHVEIIAAGAIPIFRDIQNVPPSTMFAYPKHLMAFFEQHKDETSPEKLHVWRHLMLKWGHEHLTAVAMARYMAKVTGIDLESPLASKRRVAYINDNLPLEADYQANSVLIGLIEWLGIARVDVFYFPEYLLEGNKRETKDGKGIYGSGFGYANVLKRPHKSLRQLDEMIHSLENGEYASVVWGNWHRSKIHFEDKAVIAYENRPEALWLCDGQDIYEGWPYVDGSHLPFSKATIFVRELHAV